MLCAIYAWLAENRDQEALEKMDAMIWKAPAGIQLDVVAEQDPKWSKEAMAAEFLQNLSRKRTMES